MICSIRLVALVLLFVLPLPSLATGDRIFINGDEYSILAGSTFPLDIKFSQTDILSAYDKSSAVPRLRVTDVLREYGATWKLNEGRLLLQEIIVSGGGALPLETLFPDISRQIYADWFSGVMLLGKGEATFCAAQDADCVLSGSPFFSHVRHSGYLRLELKRGYVIVREEFSPADSQRR
jgi:hypothetical protein